MQSVSCLFLQFTKRSMLQPWLFNLAVGMFATMELFEGVSLYYIKFVFLICVQKTEEDSLKPLK